MKKTIMLLAGIILLWSAPSMQQSAEFSKVVKTTDSLKDCVVLYRQYSSIGKDQVLYAKRTVEGKYIRNPRRYYHKLVETEYNYDEQAKTGFQEIYNGAEDINELLLPGPLRMLGIVRLFPEDPKATAMRGENLARLAPWDLMNETAEMARMGSITMDTAPLNNKNHLLFEITQNPGTYYNYGINRARVYADPKTFLPVRIERYTPGQSKPVAWFEYEVFETNTGLTPDQIQFEGFKNPFSLMNPPSGAQIEGMIKPLERTKLEEPAPGPNDMLSEFKTAVDQINDYHAEISMRFRYKRLRLYREDKFAYNRSPYWFTLITTKQRSNYLLLNYAAPSMLRYDPNDKSFHIIGGNVVRLLGEQIFSGIDYKFYSPMGDNPYELDFPRLVNLISEDFTNSRASSRMVEYNGQKLWEVNLVRTGRTPPCHPGKISLVIDPDSKLPRIVEFSGYDDAQALMALTVDNVEVNVGLKPTDFKF